MPISWYRTRGVFPTDRDGDTAWLLATLFVILAAAVGFLYFALFARDFAGRPVG